MKDLFPTLPPILTNLCFFLLTNLCCDQGEMRADDLQLPAESSLFVDLTRPWALTMLELGLAMQDLFQPLHVILHLKKQNQLNCIMFTVRFGIKSLKFKNKLKTIHTVQ